MKKNINILITRPLEDADGLAEHLQNLATNNLKINVFKEPLLKVEFLPATDELIDKILQNKSAIFLLTSANSIRGLNEIIKVAQINDLSKINLLAIGAASKKKANELGFTNVKAITDDSKEILSNVEGMIQYIKNNYSTSQNQNFIHISGEESVGNLAETLNNIGYKSEKITLYKTVEAKDFSDDILKKLKSKKIDQVILYSPKTARIFNDICEKNDLKLLLKNVDILTLSPKITSLLIEKGWGNIAKNIYTSAEPNEAAIIAAIEEICNQPYKNTKDNGKNFGK